MKLLDQTETAKLTALVRQACRGVRRLHGQGEKRLAVSPQLGSERPDQGDGTDGILAPISRRMTGLYESFPELLVRCLVSTMHEIKSHGRLEI